MPINYAQYTQGLQNPLASAMEGYRMGAQIKQGRLKNKLLEAQTSQAEAQRESVAQQTKRAREMQAEMAALSKKPNVSARDYIEMSTRYPALAENYDKVLNSLNDDQRRVKSDQALNIYAAVNSGQIDAAKAMLNDQREAAINSNDETAARSSELLLKELEADPDAIKTSTGLFLAKALGEDKFAETLTKMNADARAAGLQPALLEEQKSKAAKAAVEADYAESEQVIDLEKKGWDIAKIANDIDVAKANQQIAALKRKADKAKDERQREKDDLELERLKEERDQKTREKLSMVSSKRDTIDNMLSSITELQNLNSSNPGLIDDATGAIKGGSGFLGKVTRGGQLYDLQEITNFRNKIETVKAQVFMTQAQGMKGLGALSDAERPMLMRSLDSLELTNDRETLMKSLSTIQRLMGKMRQNLVTEFGVPETVIDDTNLEINQDDVMGALERNR